jgi:hypothetical protein
MSDLQLDGVLRRSPNVIDKRLDDTVVLVDIGTNRIFELNETAARVWELVGQGLDRVGILRRLVEEFDVEEGQAVDEVHNVLTRFKNEGLLAS